MFWLWLLLRGDSIITTSGWKKNWPEVLLALPFYFSAMNVLSTSQTQGTFFSVNYNWVNSICHKNCASFPHKVLSILKIKPAPPLYKVLFWVCFFNQLHKFLIFNLFIILIKIWETIVNRHEHFFFFANIIVFFPWVM